MLPETCMSCSLVWISFGVPQDRLVLGRPEPAMSLPKCAGMTTVYGGETPPTDRISRDEFQLASR